MLILLFSLFTFDIATALGPAPLGIAELIQSSNLKLRGHPDLCLIDGDAYNEAPSGSSLELERTTIKDRNGRDLPISVISIDDLKKLKNYYPPNQMLHINDAVLCEYRAHLIGASLARNGIETQKVFLQPGGTWPFTGNIIFDDKTRVNKGQSLAVDSHIANLIYVKDHDGRIKPYIIDPFLESLPVPKEHWDQRLRANPDSSIGSEDIISRFNVGYNDYNLLLNDYSEYTMTQVVRRMSN